MDATAISSMPILKKPKSTTLPTAYCTLLRNGVPQGFHRNASKTASAFSVEAHIAGMEALYSEYWHEGGRMRIA